MNRVTSRRDVLRVGVIGASVSLAGCSGGLPLSSGLDRDASPAVESDDISTVFTFDHDGEGLLELQMLYSGQSKPGAYQIPIRFQVWHRDGTHLDSLRYTLRPTPQFDHPVVVSWQAPRPNWPETDFTETGDGRGVVFDVPDLGEQGSGTVVSEFAARVPTNGESIDELPVQFGAEFALSGDGVLGADHDLALDEEVAIPVDPDR